ncbi:4216_t:CDS:2, partial [Scutellospora calospora]
QCEALLKDLKQYMKLTGQGLITTIRTSANEAVNRIKLNYTDKKTDYPKSFSARHALAVLHNNDGLLTLLETVRKVAKLPEFSEQDIINIIKIWKNRNNKCQLNIRVNDEMLKQKFYPTFASLIQDFDIFVKCNGCLSFPIKYPVGLCSICRFWAKYNMNIYIPIQTDSNISLAKSSDTDILEAILKNIFNLLEYQEYQKESIESFINRYNTLTILKTGDGKTLIYAIASLLFKGLTVVFIPLKSLMDDQLATFYASSKQPPELQERIFRELASGLTKVLLITPEKYIMNMKFRNILKKINSLRELQFVIDEAHCIKEYEYFRPDHKLEIISKPHEKEKLIQAIISVIDSITNGRIIIYSASISDCITVGQSLIKHYGSQNIGIYHSSMKSADRDITLKLWKDGEIRFMSTTNTFGIGINIPDIRAIIHTTFLMSLDSFIQEIDSDLRTLTLILYSGRESIQENIEISQEFDKLSSLTEIVAPTNHKKYLKEKRKQLLEMVHYCENKLECKQQLAYRIFTWPRDPDIPECHNCDNCCQHKAISTEWQNVSNKVNWIVRIINQLIKRVTSQDPKLLRISRDDIADCFMSSKGKNAVSKDLSSIEGYGVSSESCSIFNKDCLYLIDSLILAEIITEEVDIKYSKEAKSLLYSSSLVDLKENALNFLSTLE